MSSCSTIQVSTVLLPCLFIIFFRGFSQSIGVSRSAVCLSASLVHS